MADRLMWDAGANYYNAHVDPYVDAMVETDVQGLGPAPDYLDRGVTFEVSGTAGVGAAASARVGAKVDQKDASVRGKDKIGTDGLTVGGGVRVGIQYNPDTNR